MRDINILSEDYIDVQRIIAEAECFMKVRTNSDLGAANSATANLNEPADFLNFKHSDIVSSVKDFDYTNLFSRLSSMVDSGKVPLKKVVIISKVTDPNADNSESACFSDAGCDMQPKSFTVEPNHEGKKICFKKLSGLLHDTDMAKRDLDHGIDTNSADIVKAALEKLLKIKTLENSVD
jgi:hypothetical protein